jgi:hypothetical protein
LKVHTVSFIILDVVIGFTIDQRHCCLIGIHIFQRRITML